ncbi:hypothetical protein Mapa_007805 [Marchantia paleacea]|nr:hypothetical protein Mapa_007805 [Marchantia paleacea]
MYMRIRNITITLRQALLSSPLYRDLIRFHPLSIAYTFPSHHQTTQPGRNPHKTETTPRNVNEQAPLNVLSGPSSAQRVKYISFTFILDHVSSTWKPSIAHITSQWN